MARVSNRGPYLFPELALCKGPSAEGVTGSGSYAELFGYSWGLSLDDDGALHLAQLQNGAWVEVTPLSPFPPLSATARHISIAFDQAARPVIAWEDAGGVYLRHYDAASSGFANLGPFAGHDPLLWMDATVDGYIPDSDVLIYYLSPDSTAIKARVQRQLWATETQKYSGPDALWLDQVTLIGYAFQIVAARQSDGQTLTLRAAPYPVRHTDNLTSQSFQPPVSATLRAVVLLEQIGPDALSSAGFLLPASASYEDAAATGLRTERLGPDTLTAVDFTPPASASLLDLVVVDGPHTDTLTAQSFSPSSSAAFAVVVISTTQPTQNLTSVGFVPPSGATYA